MTAELREKMRAAIREMRAALASMERERFVVCWRPLLAPRLPDREVRNG